MTSALLAVVLLVLAGLPLAAWFEPSSGWRWRVGAGFLLGAGTLTLLMLAATFAGVHWSAALVVTGLALVAVGTMPLALRLPKQETARPRLRPLAIAADAATLLSLAGYALFATVARPWEWDFWAMWGLKAKEFLLVRGVNFAYLSHADNAFSHPDYPPLVPLVYDFVALLEGRWDDRWMGVISIAFAAAMLLVAREELERRCESAEAGAVGALALSGVACSPWVGLAEGALVACVTSGVLVLSRALREESDRAFLAGSLLVAIGTLTKNEGTSFAIAVVVATLLVAPRRAPRLLAVVVAVAAPWSIALRLNATSSELFEGSFTARVIERLSAPGEFVATLVEGQFDRAGFWLILGAALALAPATLRRERFILVVVALQSLAYLAIYAGTSHDFRSHVLGSLGRLSSQLAPLVAVVAIAGIVELLRSAPGGGRVMENEHE